MKSTATIYPPVRVESGPCKAVGQAGGVLLTKTVAAAGLDTALAEALGPWQQPLATHTPHKILLDLAVMLALGGDCLADLALLRSEPGVYGLVASDPTVSRMISRLATDPEVLTAIHRARAIARARVWDRAGTAAPNHQISAQQPLIIDLDATLVTAHSEKEEAAATYKRGFGFHPLCAFVDHGQTGTGEPVGLLLRAGNAGSNTAADHLTVLRHALAQLPGYRPGVRPGRKILIRTDAAGCTHDVVAWLSRQRLSYSLGFTLPFHTAELLEKTPANVWTPALDADGEIRDGAWVAELTGLLDLSKWPAGMRVIARKERPHPGAQLRLTDVDGHRITAFATNTPRGQLPALELRHRRRARAEDRIRIAKDTGLTNLPLHGFAANQLWCALVELALDLTAWCQLLALTDHQARRWEPKRLRLRLFTIPAVLIHHGRRVWLRIADHARWANLATTAVERLTAPT